MADENVTQICSSCIEEKKENTQKNIESLLLKMKESNKEFFVKAEFLTEDKSVENMWVKIHTVNEESRTMTGKVWNEPHIAKHLKHSEEIEVKFENIIQFLEAN